MKFKYLNFKSEIKIRLKLNANKIKFIKKLQTKDSFLKRIARDIKSKIKINGK